MTTPVKKKIFTLKPRSLGITTYVTSRLFKDIEITPWTKKKQRQAKKGFKKTKQVPHGCNLLYQMHTSISDHLVSPNVKNFQARIQEHSIKMFKKPYYSLTSQQQTKLFEDLNTGDKSSKDTVH